MTKLLFTSKSTSRFVVPPLVIVTGCESTILIPERLALGKVTLGELVLDSTVPFLSVTVDLLGSMMKRKPLYVPAASVVCPSVAATPFCRDSRSNDAAGDATVFHPPVAELS